MNIKEIKNNWSEVLNIISQKVNSNIYESMIKKAFPLSVENDTLIISTPNEFVCNYLENRYKEQFFDSIKEALKEEFKLNFVVLEEKNNEEVKKEHKKNINVVINPNISNSYNNLNEKYTFETFVVGNHNRFANAAAIKVAESPGKVYNPLFIYGDVGLGKTHLMHSVGNQMIKNFSNVKVAYISSERFTNELINSIKDDKMIEFRNKYRNIDLLLIDDIQFITGKERTQEEFFHTFNSLYEEGKQIIISSDRPPKEISALEDRLRSRFEMGLITDIQAPDFETRIAILKKKCELENIEVSDEILHYIASIFKDNVRELEGALIRVTAYAQLINTEANVNLAKTILGREPLREVSLEDIQKAVAKFYGIEIEDLLSNLKTKEITWARHIAMYISRDLTKAPFQKISTAFKRKDHTTVMHAIEKIKNLVQNDSSIHKEVQSVIESIYR